MAENEIASEEKSLIARTIDEVTEPFKNLFKSSRVLLGLNISYLIEGLTYFGILGLLAMFFNQYAGLDDATAGMMVSVQTAGITIAMLLLGATVDMIGVRKALLWSLSAMMIGRLVLSLAPSFGETGVMGAVSIVSLIGILGIIVGYGIYQPACYTAIKQFTNPKFAGMGYSMLYAVMNLGSFFTGFVSPPIRHAYGIDGVFWVFTSLTLIGIVVVYFMISKKAQDKALKDSGFTPEADAKEKDTRPLGEKLKDYIRRFPIKDGRFMFFIFILIPVQTLFAHNWLTIPQYCARAFSGVVSDYFEFFVNFNPILIFILTPSIAALTSKKHTYKMMIWGTLIMGISPFILVGGPNMTNLLAYIILMTIGEAMWQPRFLQWVAEIAPKDMTGIYMGLGQFPWFLTKMLTGTYSGWFLMNFCPQDAPPSAMNTEMMWLIYGCISIVTPVSLIIFRKWMLKGFNQNPA
jgi:MFS family permease